VTALSTIQEATTEIGLSEPTVVFSSTDANIITLRTMMNTTAKMIRDAGEWVELTKEHTFTTSASTETYNLPSDYDHINVETGWDRTDFTKLRESLSGPVWQAIKSGIIQQAGAFSGFRIRGHTSGQFYIDPTPSSSINMVYEYQSKNTVLTSGSVEQVAFTSDDDTFILDEYYLMLGCVWRFNRAKGFPWREQFQEWNLGVQNQFGRHSGAPVIDMGNNSIGSYEWPYFPANIQEGNFLI
jgi:hypothetical protein